MILGPYRNRSKFHVNIVPDKDDLNNYCRSCEKAFSIKLSYKKHLRDVHNIEVTIATLKKSNPNILPDENDLNFYCKSCNTKLKSKRYYRLHLKYVHRMVVKPEHSRPFYDPNMEKVDEKNTKNTSCFTCKLTFNTRHGYQGHMARHTKAGDLKKPLEGAISKSRRAYSGITPNLDDRNWYCNLCEKKYNSARDYRLHLRMIHDMVKNPRPTRNPAIIPEIDDRTHTYCISCNHDYKERYTYVCHLRNIHHLKI